MPYVSPATVVTGTTITSAWGNSVKTAADYIADGPACRVYHNTTQSVADITETSLVFNSDRFDPTGMHDTVSNTGRITFNDAGVYVVSFVCEFASAVDYFTIYSLCRLNGATVIARSTHNRGDSGDGSSMATTYSTIYKFAAADYIETRVYQNNTANAARNVLSTGNFSPEFSAAWLCRG